MGIIDRYDFCVRCETRIPKVNHFLYSVIDFYCDDCKNEYFKNIEKKLKKYEKRVLSKTD